jgi:amidase
VPDYWKYLNEKALMGKRLGLYKEYLKDSLYRNAVSILVDQGADTISFVPKEMNFQGFLDLLVGEMSTGLEAYIRDQASDNIGFSTVDEIVTFNRADTLNRIPYGQALFEYMATASLSEGYLDSLRDRFHHEGVRYFMENMEARGLDAVLSINNYNAGQAAMARFPCLTVPMGYKRDGEPQGLTFIGKPWKESELLEMGYAFEQATNSRIPPVGY